MKKVICLLLACTMLFSLCACGKEDVVNEDDSKSNEAMGNAAESEESGYQVGDYITFGSYEQDNDTSNGAEGIEWLILDVQDGKALVISKYALVHQKYNDEFVDITWENCTLREWLNNDFLNSAFSEDEQARIPTVTVTADENPSYDTNSGNDTEDKIFVLSIAEAYKYFSSDEERLCQPTEYAVANGVFKNDRGNCWWLLRSPGYYQDTVSRVSFVGVVDENGVYVNYISFSVRPAMWIEIE